MVRLNTHFAGAVLVGAALTIAAPHAQAQSNVPGPATAPVTSSDVMHWTADPKHGVRPATPSGQPVTPAGQPVAPGASHPSLRQSSPASQAAPPTATMTAPPTTSQPATAASHRRSRKTAVAEPPAAPPPPPTPEQLPPNPPQVRYQNGELTIDAQNSTMTQVLRAVGSQTGASVDLPAGAGNERVVAQLGPGLPGDVLRTLLNGSRFDYVILGVAGNPGAVQKVILTPRQTAAPSATAQNHPTPQPTEEPDEGPVAETEPEYQNQNPQPPALPGGFRRPGIPFQPPDQQQQSFSAEQQNEGKSPEQLMQELQQIQQQQQQYQEQLNPANRQPPLQ